jgi:hypothetical protein
MYNCFVQNTQNLQTAIKDINSLLSLVINKNVETLILQYNRKNFSETSIKNGNLFTYFDVNNFTSTNSFVNKYSLLQLAISGQDLTINGNNYYQETYTYSVSDENNKSVGSLQYIMNYVQKTSGTTTTLAFLDARVFSANGIFKFYYDACIHQTFDNVTGNRTITISHDC